MVKGALPASSGWAQGVVSTMASDATKRTGTSPWSAVTEAVAQAVADVQQRSDRFGVAAGLQARGGMLAAEIEAARGPRRDRDERRAAHRRGEARGRAAASAARPRWLARALAASMAERFPSWVASGQQPRGGAAAGPAAHILAQLSAVRQRNPATAALTGVRNPHCRCSPGTTASRGPRRPTAVEVPDPRSGTAKTDHVAVPTHTPVMTRHHSRHGAAPLFSSLRASGDTIEPRRNDPDEGSLRSWTSMRAPRSKLPAAAAL